MTKIVQTIAGIATQFEIVRIISEHKKSRGKCPKGQKLVQAVIKAGKRIETRHICVPR